MMVLYNQFFDLMDLNAQYLVSDGNSYMHKSLI